MREARIAATPVAGPSPHGRPLSDASGGHVRRRTPLEHASWRPAVLLISAKQRLRRAEARRTPLQQLPARESNECPDAMTRGVAGETWVSCAERALPDTFAAIRRSRTRTSTPPPAMRFRRKVLAWLRIPAFQVALGKRPVAGDTPLLSRGELRRGRELRLDVDRDAAQPLQQLLHLGTHHAEALNHLLRLRVAPLSLQRHDLAGQGGDGVADLRVVHRERAVLPHLERAGV